MQEGESIQRIRHGNEVYAIIVRAFLPFEGYNFVSADEDSLQVGVNHYKEGDQARPHFHLPLQRALADTLEVLHIVGGSCRLTLFGGDKRKFYNTTLNNGDTVVLLKGGHSLDILESTRILEVKQGPYLGVEKDKVFFEAEE